MRLDRAKQFVFGERLGQVVFGADNASAGAIEQDLASVTSRLETVEAAVAAHAPAIAALQDVATSVVEGEVPSAAPLIARVEALEQWVIGIVTHFQGKVPPLTPG